MRRDQSSWFCLVVGLSAAGLLSLVYLMGNKVTERESLGREVRLRGWRRRGRSHRGRGGDKMNLYQKYRKGMGGGSTGQRKRRGKEDLEGKWERGWRNRYDHEEIDRTDPQKVKEDMEERRGERERRERREERRGEEERGGGRESWLIRTLLGGSLVDQLKS